MAAGRPIAELPERVTFELGEVADLLSVVDLAVARTVSGTPERAEARRVQRLITMRLWPELGELLDESDDEEG